MCAGQCAGQCAGNDRDQGSRSPDPMRDAQVLVGLQLPVGPSVCAQSSWELILVLKFKAIHLLSSFDSKESNCRIDKKKYRPSFV